MQDFIIEHIKNGNFDRSQRRSYDNVELVPNKELNFEVVKDSSKLISEGKSFTRALEEDHFGRDDDECDDGEALFTFEEFGNLDQ